MTEKVLVVFKTHLDVGFTDLAANVIDRYFKQFIPSAISLARSLREKNNDRFVWTTGSWLIYEYLEQAASKERRELELAIQAGDIVWHALPFTTHTELMDADLFRFGLSLSQELDRRFGKRTISAKLTDVPGHTRGIVPLLAEAGVELLHIGVNPASAVPDIPPIFRWQSAGGQEVTVIYQGEYGSTFTLPQLPEALVITFTNDNLGPPTEEQVQQIFTRLHKEFPKAQVMASTLDEFARALEPVKDSLPVVTSEIGDTWIHGIGSDPLKVMQFRELLRLQKEWLLKGKITEIATDVKSFNRRLLMVSEHTWGVDIKTHLADTEHYLAKSFQKARTQPNFKKVETSWDEKRQYIDRAIRSLWNKDLAKEASERLLHLKASPPDVTGSTRLAKPPLVLKESKIRADFDPHSGALATFQLDHDFSRQECRLGEVWYRTYDHSDYDRVWRQYIRHSPMVELWAKADFTKPGLEKTGAVSKKWLPQVRDFYVHNNRVLIFATFETVAHTDYGAPEMVTLEWIFEPEKLDLTLQIFNKSACRLPEAMWLTMQPGLGKKIKCQMDKLGEWVDPLDVVSRGNRALHAIGDGVEYTDEHGQVTLRSLDAPLMSPGIAQQMDFTDTLPDMHQGPHFNLFNNLWGTNFPMWFEGDLKFRFEISIL